MSDIPQARVLTLIEQATKELDGEYEATSREVQIWLSQHGYDLTLPDVSSNLRIVRHLDDEEQE